MKLAQCPRLFECLGRLKSHCMDPGGGLVLPWYCHGTMMVPFRQHKKGSAVSYYEAVWLSCASMSILNCCIDIELYHYAARQDGGPAGASSSSLLVLRPSA